MVFKKSFSTRIPAAPQLHRLFGRRYVKMHLIGDDTWTPHTLTNQYRCMGDLLSKHNELKKLELTITQNQQSRKIRKLKQDIEEGHDRLKQTNFGDNQNLRNILQGHKDILYLCEKLPMDKAINAIKHKVFVKRKESDRERHDLEKLMKEYEEKLKELTDLEDHINSNQEDISLPEESKIKKIRIELTNIQTRIKAVKIVRNCYRNIVQILMQDAVYYGSVLDALQKDIKEQEHFIDFVIYLGQPATVKLPKLREEYKKLERTKKLKIRKRIEQLRIYKKKVNDERVEMIRQLHNTVMIEPDPLLYSRESPSIIDLKKDLDEFEKIIKKLKNATSTTKIDDMVKKMKIQYESNARLKNVIDLFENQKELLEQKEFLAKQAQDMLNYSYTKEEIEQIEKVKQLKEKITIEKKTQNEITEYIKDKGETFLLLGSALDHINETLRNVGDELERPTTRSYPNDALKLPLLNFEMYGQKTTPPLPVEEDMIKLLNSANNKLSALMKMYNQLSEEDIMRAKEMYGRYFKDKFNPRQLLEIRQEYHKPIDEEEEDKFIDPDVLTREQIKNTSAKIVEENIKKNE